jgi:NADH-quinone oxidoreductase subunit J
MDVILFLVFSAIAVACALSLVVQRHPISSAISLVGVMASLAILYLLLGGEFIAMAQMIVYAGAIMVLFVFTIMLLNAGAEKRGVKRPWAVYVGIPLLTGLLGIISFLAQGQVRGSPPVILGGFTGGTAADVGRALFTRYVLPFEVVSVLVLIAILGAMVLARKEIE